MRLRDLPFLVDDVRDAARVLVLPRLGGAIRHADRAVGVAEEREGEVVLFREAPVGLLVVEADAEDAGVLLLVLADEVPEPGTFPRSTGCVGLRVEPEHDLLAAKVAEADVVPLVIAYVEVGCLLAGLEHLSLPTGERLDDSADGHAGIVGP
jgi:hypothetical protein